MEAKSLEMVTNMRVTTLMVNRMVKGNTNGVMGPTSRAPSEMDFVAVRESITVPSIPTKVVT